MIVLDTNILSELMRSGPDEAVLAWMSRQPMMTLFITAITQAEILYGLALLPKGRRRDLLIVAARAMFEEDFSGRILPFDGEAARVYAEIASRRRQAGEPISQFDAQIAAITQSRGASLATRNTRDFLNCGITLINPWDEA
ncbi:type II toxin-antitoxin system VapC family toxin (plasmid) [Komagataeibacter nataicola]|uniref:type II toxin-antitoxin system VapC family toxin n=1 Tax=Komagataeibacter nataicola TaxID=265960 RepID=UPI0023DD3FD3|nr:type II toxin-antitoxin system VapC family toxin [Komagataeibacter nataicola]WEQ54239.1 type II toxin-antitoxin system VapC family toxin [Komagataeibacter nataicola]